MSEKPNNTEIEWDIDLLEGFLEGGNSAHAIDRYRTIQSYNLPPLSPLSLKLHEVELKHLQAAQDMGATGLHAKMQAHIQAVKQAQSSLPFVN